LNEAKSAFENMNNNSLTNVKIAEKLSNRSKSLVKKDAQPKKKTGKKITSYTAEEVDAVCADIKIFTDGACEPNPGKAGSGIALYRNGVVCELWYGFYKEEGTNNIAELNGLHQALALAKEPVQQGKSVVIFCDSMYSIQCVTQWAINWKMKNWTKKGGEIKNLELIKEIFSLYELLKDEVQVIHVNGHSGIEGNELADRMSILAIEDREFGFSRYREEIKVQDILSLRKG